MTRLGLLVLAACSGPAAPAPEATPTAPPGTRIIVGGDSRDDSAHVIPWAFHEAKLRGVSAFVFLGDMELTPALDARFAEELAQLDPIPFYPTLGNHEVKRFGVGGIAKADLARDYRARFLDTRRTPIGSSIDGKIVYSVELAGGVHFIALDNVSQKGFGDAQLTWLASDLDKASADPHVRFIIVGMHKPLAHNGITEHGMDRDGAHAIEDSDAALALFQRDHVAMIFESHDHRYASFTQGGIPCYITGGLGAPLDHRDPPNAFHHFLQLDIDASGIHVTVVRFPGAPSVGEEPVED
jgi:hypothetical protein